MTWTWNTRYNTKWTRHWKHGSNWIPSGRLCSTRWKLQVYDALIRNKLLYILWTRDRKPHTNPAKESECIAIAGPEKIHGCQHNFCQPFKVQIQTNMHCKDLQRANEEIGHSPGTPNKVKLFSDLLKDRQVKLAGDILRSNRRRVEERRGEKTWDVLTWAGKSWERDEKRWDNPPRAEIRWSEMRWNEMGWDGLRSDDLTWEERWRAEKSWVEMSYVEWRSWEELKREEFRWREQRWEKLRWHEKAWEQLWSAEKSWDGIRWHKFRWSGTRWKIKRGVRGASCQEIVAAKSKVLTRILMCS